MAKPQVSKTARTRKTALIVPTLSLKGMSDGDSLYIRAESEMMYVDSTTDTGEKQLKKDGTPKQMALIRATNLDTGEYGQMVCPAIVERAFKDYHTLNGYITGASFELIRGKSLGTGKANLWQVYEIEGAEHEAR